MSPTRHAALCTCAPSRMVGGAFCQHPRWEASALPGTGALPVIVYRCARCLVEVPAPREWDR